ncbi:MAG: type II secretion system secretin GspD [Proteobacteria bacterium]|nr:type II secretion system secretin GspD [Pseudomonadota bacterium]
MRLAACVLGLALTACGVAPVREVAVPPAAETLAVLPGPGPVTARPLRPPTGIAVAPQRGEEAQPVPPTPLLVGRTGGPRGAARAPARPGAALPADITLNFEEADVRDVLAFVLRDVLKRNYVVDPDVVGTITLGVSQPITRDALLPTLEAVLNSRGATMIETDGLIRVSLLREGGKLRTTPRLVPAGPAGASATAGQEIQALPVQFAVASEIAKLLEPVLATGRVLMADDARRLLLVQGNAAELEMVRDTLAIFDVDQLAGTSVAMVLLRNADASELVPELSNMFGSARKSADAGVIRFIPIERLNAVIILARGPRFMEDARAWIGRLDRVRRGNEARLFVYHVQHGKAAEVARTLQGAFARGEVPEATPPQRAPLPDFAAAPPPPGYVQIPGVPPAAPGFSARAGTPGEPADGGPARGAAAPAVDTGTLRIRADEANNSLLIHATPREYAQVREVLEQIDIPPLQVLIEATIAEVVLQDELRYGVQYFLNSDKGNFLFTRDNPAGLFAQNRTTPNILPQTPGFAFSLLNGVNQPRVIIDALSQLTQTNVISTPRLLVLDNQVARLQVGDVVPIVTQTAVSTLTNAPLTVNSVQYRDTGVVVEVTPHVNASGFVTIDITQSVSDVVRTTTSNIDSPTIRQRRIRSSIGVQSGSTILLGGLIREDSTRSNSGLPLLSDIPVIGGLFGTRDFAADRTELIVLLTPRVVRNQEEAVDMTNAIRRKFQAVLLLEPGVMPQPRRPQYP